jgi:hypothetical protein
MKHSPAPPLLPLVACLGLFASTGVRAEPNPYYIGASQTITHDNNVLRTCDNGATDPGCPPGVPKVADTISTTSLLGGFDQPISRQRLHADAALNVNRYKNRSDLNNNGYHVDAGWDWETIGNLSGKLSALLNRQLAQYSLGDALSALNALNMETNRQYAATAALGGVTKLTFEGGVTHREVDYSNAIWASREYRQDAGTLGVKYRPSDLLTLGVGLRETRGEYDPSGSSLKYRRHDLDLTGTWLASGASTIDARLSFGRQHYETSTSRDFSGATGSLQWRWKPTGKLNFYTLLLRDTGTEAGLFYTGVAEISPTGITLQTQAGDISRVTNLARVLGEYEMTAKIKLTASAANSHRSLVNTLSLTPDSGSDDTVTGTLGVRYVPTRSIAIGCDVSRERRSVSLQPTSTLSYPYNAHVYSCMGQFVLK